MVWSRAIKNGPGSLKTTYASIFRSQSALSIPNDAFTELTFTNDGPSSGAIELLGTPGARTGIKIPRAGLWIITGRVFSFVAVDQAFQVKITSNVPLGFQALEQTTANGTLEVNGGATTVFALLAKDDELGLAAQPNDSGGATRAVFCFLSAYLVGPV